MRPPEDLTTLARQMLERRQSEFYEPLILFLGQECGIAAGVPSNLEIARQLFSDPDLSQIYLEGGDLEDDESVEKAFIQFLDKMTSGQRYRMLKSFYASLPVPSFYQDLALLVKAGFFRHILTTNIDALLEGALNGAGLWPGKDYQVLSLGRGEEMPWRSRQYQKRARSAEPSEVDIHLIKLHGDLTQEQVAITPEEISDALEPQRHFVKGELSGDLLMVGYKFESEPLTKWLSYVPGELWWVSVHPPDEERIEEIEERRPVRHINGDVARPQVFFGQLVYLLLQSRISSTQQISEQYGFVLAGAKGPMQDVAPVELPDEDDYSDAEYLRSQLRQSQAVLMSLEQSQAPGEHNVQLQAQIEYQRRRVADLEDQILVLSESRERVVDLLGKVHDAVEFASADPHVAIYVQNQVSSVIEEYEREQPNQSIVSAAIGATVVLAERMGPDVVNPELLNELASFAPSAVGKRL